MQGLLKYYESGMWFPGRAVRRNAKRMFGVWISWAKWRHGKREYGFESVARGREGRPVENDSKCPVSGKRKYASEAEALATAAHQIATTNAPRDLRAYLCSWCEAWHLTKNAGRTGKGRR